MDAVASLAQTTYIQRGFEVIAALMLTAYLFPKQAVVNEGDQFDFIVVGAGSAGAVVAARLAESQYSVLLVEAGGDPPQESLAPALLGFLPRTKYDWNYTTENDNYSFQCHRSRTANLTSGRMLGGGSSINYMFYVRGCPGDFQPWATAANDSTWDWNGVLPYFIKSEKLRDHEIINSPLIKHHGTDGFLGVCRQTSIVGDKYLEAFKELGNNVILDINSNDRLGYTHPMFTISDGVRQSTAYTVLGALKQDNNLHVLKHTLVTKIIFDEQNNAVGVLATTDNGDHITLRTRREVVVSAGALSTPRLLMLSGIGPEEHLHTFDIPVRSELPVGTNLQDHPSILIGVNMQQSHASPSPPDPGRFPYDTITGYVALNMSDSCPDYQTLNFFVPEGTSHVSVHCVFNFGLEFEICQKIYNMGLMWSLIVLLHPQSRGRVLLRSTNPRDPPLIHGGYLSDERDLETIVDSVIDFVKILNTSQFKSISAEMVDFELEGCRGLEYRSREWWRCYVKCLMTSLYHYSGTCALGSVVDSRLRVFGVNRLRVVDASVMPSLISANTNAATIMVAEKAADFIKQEHRQRENNMC